MITNQGDLMNMFQISRLSVLERNLEIFGETVNRIRNKDKNFTLENAEKIIAARNRIIHGYDKISDDLIWSIVVNHLQKLKLEVSGMLKQ